jgi:hypothetical protein
VLLQVGNYNEQNIILEIQARITALLTEIILIVNVNRLTHKFSFSTNDVSKKIIFNFLSGLNTQRNCAKLLGFNIADYIIHNTMIQAPNIMELNYFKYLQLVIRDFSNNTQARLGLTNDYISCIDVNVLPMGTIRYENTNPTNIFNYTNDTVDFLDVCILDQYNNHIDLNGHDFNVVLYLDIYIPKRENYYFNYKRT